MTTRDDNARRAPLDETAVIGLLRQRFGAADPRLLLGIGDDAAVLRLGGATPGARRRRAADLVVTTDLAVEGVHFDLRYMSLADVGYKTLVMNLSDLAAMGAVPSFAFACLGLPRTARRAQVEDLLDGVEEAARLGDVRLAGGDTVAAPQWVLGFTVLGGLRGQPLTRAAARPGDVLWHSGQLGLSQCAFHELWAGVSGRRRRRVHAELALAHLRPQPQLELGAWLQRKRLASACIDLSDSLSQCLLLLADASAVGLAVDFQGYLFADEVRQFAGRRSRADSATGFTVPAAQDPAGKSQVYASLAQFLLASAEDFQLLLTAAPSATARLLRAAPVPLTRLGTVVDAAQGCRFRDERGVWQQLQPSGFEHLASRQ